MIINPIVCNECDRELQPENLGVDIDMNGNLLRVCMFCGSKTRVTTK